MGHPKAKGIAEKGEGRPSCLKVERRFKQGKKDKKILEEVVKSGMGKPSKAQFNIDVERPAKNLENVESDKEKMILDGNADSGTDLELGTSSEESDNELDSDNEGDSDSEGDSDNEGESDDEAGHKFLKRQTIFMHGDSKCAQDVLNGDFSLLEKALGRDASFRVIVRSRLTVMVAFDADLIEEDAEKLYAIPGVKQVTRTRDCVLEWN